MNRYCLMAYIENSLIYYEELSSITKVAMCMDRFKTFPNLWFDIVDDVKGISINPNEIMRLWHA